LHGFANAVLEAEARELYDRWTIPAPCRPLFQAATATFAIAPPIPGKASLKKYNSSVITEFKLFEGRGHSLIVDQGWRELSTRLHGLIRMGFEGIEWSVIYVTNLTQIRNKK
jgi:non-heme chloroperoxidase